MTIYEKLPSVICSHSASNELKIEMISRFIKEEIENCKKENEEKLRWIPVGEKMPDKDDKSQFIVKGIYGAIQTRNVYCLMLTLDTWYSEPQFRHYPHFIPTHWRFL